MGPIHLKRVYEAPDPADGRRILVERLWPRGVSKERAALDAWVKEVAPTAELRRWFNHDPERWTEFQNRYRAELERNDEAVEELERLCQGAKATFVYAAHDEEHNAAVVLKHWLEGRRGGSDS